MDKAWGEDVITSWTGINSVLLCGEKENAELEQQLKQQKIWLP